MQEREDLGSGRISQKRNQGTSACGGSGLPTGILGLSAWLFPWGPGAWLVLFSLLLNHTNLINVPS